MAVDLKGKVTNQAGADKVGLTVQLWEAANWETPGAATATTTTDSDGLWQFLAQDATKTWLICVIDGTKKLLIDARNRLQLTKLDLITDINTDIINEHTAASGVTIDGVLLKDSAVALAAIPTPLTGKEVNTLAAGALDAMTEIAAALKDAASGLPVLDAGTLIKSAQIPVITDTQHGVRTLASAHAHTALSGVTADQHHAQAHAVDGASDHSAGTQGDILYAGAAGAWARLGAGASGQFLKTQGAGANPVWAGAAIISSSGSYTGDGTDDRAIAHGLGATPKIVLMETANSASIEYLFRIQAGAGFINCYDTPADTWAAISGVNYVVPAMDATNFYVGTALGDRANAGNGTGKLYRWVALV